MDGRLVPQGEQEGLAETLHCGCAQQDNVLQLVDEE